MLAKLAVDLTHQQFDLWFALNNKPFSPRPFMEKKIIASLFDTQLL